MQRIEGVILMIPRLRRQTRPMVSNPSPHNSDFPRLLPVLLDLPNLNLDHPPHSILPLPLTPTPILARARARASTRNRTGVIASPNPSVGLLRRHKRQLTPRTHPGPRRPSPSTCPRSHLDGFKDVAIKQVLRDDKHIPLSAVRLHHSSQYRTELGVRCTILSVSLPQRR